MQVLKEQFTSLGTVVETEQGKKIQLKSTAHYQTQLNKLPIGKEVSIQISTKQYTRSQTQLAYFMVLVGYIADYTGHSKDEMYPILIEEVYPPKEILWKGEMRKVRRSISDMAKMPSYDMGGLIEHALATCSDLEINVPTAQELGYIQN